MPAAIPFVIQIAGTAFAWGTLATSLATLGASLAVGAYEQKRAKQKARDAYNKSLQDHFVPIKSGVSARCYVLGTVRTSGPVQYVETIGPKKSAFDIIIAIANNECTLNGWYLNEEFISAGAFPGTKYGTKVAVPTRDEFNVTGPSTSVVLSAVPVTTVNQVRCVYRQGSTTGFATATPAGGQNVNLTGLPSGACEVTLTYSSYQAEHIAVQFQEGSESQTASDWSSLGLTSPGWTSDHRLRGIANARMLLQWEENIYQTGAPALGVRATGRATASHPFYDPRNGSNPATTKNPAILAAWWMTLPRNKGGCGIPTDWIDWQSVSVAASICDEQIQLKNHDGSGYTTGPRYECNCLLSTDDAPLVNLETILSAMAGRKAFTAGKYKIVAGAFRPATVTITDRDTVGTEPLGVATGSNEDSPPNIVTATFADERADFLETQPTPVKNDTYITADQAEQPLDISLPATTDARRARYLMGIALEGSRPAMTCQITVGGIGEDLAIFDTVLLSLTNRSAYAGRTFEIVNIVDRWDGTFDLALAEIRPQTWALDPDDYTPIDPAELPDLSYLWNPPHPTGFTVGAITPQLLPDGTSVTKIALAWDAMPDPGNSPNARIELRYRQTGGEWVGIASVPGDATGSTVTANLANGEIYQFQARFVNGVGAASTWVDAYTQVAGTPLPVPLSMRLRATSTIFRVPQTGNALPSSITFEVSRTAGLTEAAVFGTSPSVTLTGSGDTRTLTYANMGANDSVTVTCTVSQASVDYVDTVTILKVYDGVDADNTPDLTPPPAPSGLTVTSFTVHLLVTWTPPAYSEGHGHDATRVYAAPWPTGSPAPTFANAVEQGSSNGNSFILAAAPGQRFAVWAKHQSRDGVLSAAAGGTNGVVGTATTIGNTNLGPLVVEAGNLADGAVTSAKLVSGAVDATKFASGIQPVGIVTGSLPNPSGYTGPRIVFNTSDDKLYRYTGTAWVVHVASSDIAGQLGNEQIASIAAAKLTGTITETQIANDAITTPKLAASSVTTNNLQANAVTASNIAAGAVTTPKLAAGAVTANELAANSVIAGKIAAGAVSANEIAANAITAAKIAITGRGAALNDDPAGIDATAWERTYSGNAQFGLPSSLSPNGRVIRFSNSAPNADGAFSRLFPIVQGKRYRTSCWARQVSGGGPFYFRLHQYDSADNLLSYSIGYEAISLSGSFARLSGIIETAPTATQARIEIVANYGANGVVDVADVRCEEVIPGELIVDGAITARKLFITSGGGAINEDPGTLDRTAWNYNENGTYGIVAVTDTPGISSVIQSVTGAQSIPLSRAFAFNPNKTYRVRARARAASANGTFYLLVDLKDSVGSRIGVDGTFWFYPVPGISLPGSFTQYEGRFGAGTARPFPSNARTMAVGAILNYQATAGYQQVTDLLIEECVDSGLIVDGAIQATHLAANSIAVGTAAIQNGAIINAMIANAAIDDAKILNLTVNKISGGTLGADIAIGAGRITYDNGVVMRVQGTGFGTSGQFVDWYGLRPAGGNISLCSESNATYYLKTNGDAYFGGLLSAGLLKNAAQTTDTGPNAEVELGPFLTNGNNKNIVFTYSWSRSYRANANTGSVSGTGTAQAVLEISLNGTTWTVIDTLNVSQTGGTVIVDGDPGVKDTVIFSMGGSHTITNSQGATNAMRLRSRLISRTFPTFGGSNVTQDDIRQSLGFICTE